MLANIKLLLTSPKSPYSLDGNNDTVNQINNNKATIYLTSPRSSHHLTPYYCALNAFV